VVELKAVLLIFTPDADVTKNTRAKSSSIFLIANIVSFYLIFGKAVKRICVFLVLLISQETKRAFFNTRVIKNKAIPSTHESSFG